MTDTHGTFVLDTAAQTLTELGPEPDTSEKSPRFTATYRCADGAQISVADAPDRSTTLTVSVTDAAGDDHFVKVSLASADSYRVRSMLYDADEAATDIRSKV